MDQGSQVRSSNPNLRSACLILAGASASWLALLALLVTILPDALQAALLSLLFVICTLPWFYWRLEPDVCAPIYLTSVFLTLIYPVRTLMLLAFPEYTVSYFPPPYSSEIVTRGLVYTSIGLLVYLLVYYHPPKVLILRFRQISFNLSVEGWPIRILTLYAFGWVIRTYQISTGNYLTFLTGEGHDESTYTLLATFSEVALIAYILTWVYWLSQKNRDLKSWLLLLTVIVPEAAYALIIQGSKTHLVRQVVFIVMAYCLVRRRAAARLLVPAAAFVVFFVFPYVQVYRDIYLERVGARLSVSVENGLSVAGETLSQMYNRTGYYEAGLSTDVPFAVRSLVVFLNRWAGFDGVAAIMTVVPDQFGYVYGRDLRLVPFSLIPRFIWPDKPLSDVGTIFDKEIVMTTGSSVSPYPIAEGFFNGGMLGVVFVASSLAIFQKILYSGFFTSRREQPLAIVVYIWMFVWVTWIDSWVLPMYVYLSQRAAVTGLVCLFMAGSAGLAQKGNRLSAGRTERELIP